MKVICQNCFEVLAGRKVTDGKVELNYDSYRVQALYQKIDGEHHLVTLKCPKCDCTLQIKQ